MAARIAGVILPSGKHAEIALTYIYGIGRAKAQVILDEVKIERTRKIDDLSEAELDLIRDAIKGHIVEGDLRRLISGNIKRLQEFKEVPIPPSKVEDETANWKTYRNEEYGFEIKYPEKLNTEFISLHSKSVPPKMVVSSNISQLVCEEFERKSTVEFPTASQKKITVEGETYCRFSGAEGTAGTTYVTYRYSTIKNEKQITLEFTLLYPDCGNYYGIDNKMEKCRREEDVFDPDILAHQMLSTFRFLE